MGLALLALALVPGPPAARAGAAPLTLAPCEVAGLAPGEARCGTYEVFEDRGGGRGRKVPLRVVVVPAKESPREPDPLVYLAGGPGDSATAAAGFGTHAYADLRRRRDLVFIDLRGTGESAGLFCPELERSQGFLDEFLPVEGVRACRQRLAARADLAQYTTANAVDDLAEVFTALGYSRVNLDGASYGTRTALEMIRRHPQRVRTAALSGIVPPGARNPLTFARDAQEALEGTLAECAADAACAAAFPRLRDELAAVLARVEREPVSVEVAGRDGSRQALRLDRAGVAQTLRYMLYMPTAAAELPFAVHAAATGDFQPLAQMAALFAGSAAKMADGFFLSVLCTEDTPFIREDEIAPAVAGTFLGDFRIRAQQRACAEWGVPAAARELQEPVRAEVPVLLVSGERDPVTPVRWGEQVARHLPRALHVVVPDGGHGSEGMAGAECLTSLVEGLVTRGDTRGLDTSCVGTMRRPPFTTAGPAPEVNVAPAELAPLAGSYASDEGLQVDVRLADGRLGLTLSGKDFVLVPIGERRFRVEGLPAGYGVEFFGAARVEGLRLLQGAGEPLTLMRR
jgi:pimeloyl-ACP methyl ester carboxylesterase